MNDFGQDVKIMLNNLNRESLRQNRIQGISALLAGLFLLAAPFFLSGLITFLLGLFLLVESIASIFEAIRSQEESASFASYFQSGIRLLLGIVLLFAPTGGGPGLALLISFFFLFEGTSKIYSGLQQTGTERFGNLYNGLFNVLLAILFWYVISLQLTIFVVSIFFGLRLIAESWRIFLQPVRPQTQDGLRFDFSQHIDPLINLEPNTMIEPIQKERYQMHLAAKGQYAIWNGTFLVIFFAIHLFRTGGDWSLLGIITPFSALIGDILMAFLIALLLIIPSRLLWRRILRPLEERSWQYLIDLDKDEADYSYGEQLLKLILVQSIDFNFQLKEIRSSLQYAFWRVLGLGLPLTTIFIAVNSIWGFSWYFNTENWSSAVWQKLTEEHVDTWRQAMAERVEANALAQGISQEDIFSISPAGVDESEDFSFIIVGDPGEGDASQLVLVDQFIDLGKKDEVKFLIVSSDVIYPDGKMRDYEANFYLPFKGFTKPIYAIPGNHDWFDANQGFNANFLEPESALISLQSRLDNSLFAVDVVAGDEHQNVVDQAGELREHYQIQNGLQRAPYFDMHTPGFSLITLDTGILKTIDEKQRQWLEASLQRAGDNFKLVLLGHPLYAAGAYQGEHSDSIAELHQLFREYDVNVSMAGDYHDFEFYRETYPEASAEHEMVHFVNGGGGAYLSIGTALDYPEEPVTEDYAVYPSEAALLDKLNKETPGWKQPFLFWIKTVDGYPLSTETLSGIFDFNNAPFFQSFMEVKVERSKNRVRFLVYGANGPLQWKDLDLGGGVKPTGQSDDDFVEFIIPLTP